MELVLKNHDYKYALEQMMLILFPRERPVYPEDGQPTGEPWAVSSLAEGKSWLTVTTVLRIGGKRYTGSARVRADALSEPFSAVRLKRRAVKRSFYKAAVAYFGKPPVWGSLSGIRPAKLMRECLEAEPDEGEAMKRFMREYEVSPERAALCLSAATAALEAEHALEARDVCLYVGIPFCPTRCAYCSFVSQSVEKSMKLVPPFLDALEKEIAATAARVKKLGLRPVSLYMGGGTPTTLEAPQLDRLCAVLAENFDLSALREYTVEAGRPDTITEEKLRVLRAHGVDRVSVNPQTMSDRVLELIGRRHTAADIVSALEKVRRVGGFDVNMDLIAGLPGDSAEGFRETLEKVLTLGAENVTVHTLSLKKGSRITLDQTPIPGAEEVAAMLDYAGERLTAAGYAPYYLYRQKFMSGGFENVGWAKDGRINLYNIVIMEELRSILAMGGGGSTKLVRPDGGRNIRLMAPKYPLEYIEKIDETCAEKEKISDFYRQLSISAASGGKTEFV